MITEWNKQFFQHKAKKKYLYVESILNNQNMITDTGKQSKQSSSTDFRALNTSTVSHRLLQRLKQLNETISERPDLTKFET